LALGLELRDAVEKGIGFLQNAINISKDIRLGRGNGPVVTNIYK
jgi:hydroxymethylpyrimidine/phosphomethylpyrimidine kinase